MSAEHPTTDERIAAEMNRLARENERLHRAGKREHARWESENERRVQAERERLREENKELLLTKAGAFKAQMEYAAELELQRAVNDALVETCSLNEAENEQLREENKEQHAELNRIRQAFRLLDDENFEVLRAALGEEA